MNIYQDSPPKLIKSFVCYVDILGFSQLSLEAIKSDNGNQFLKKLTKALANAYKRIRERSSLWANTDVFKIKVFTDNIVVGYPISSTDLGKGEYELGNIFRIFSEFQIALVMEGFLIRGGISFGEHYMNDDIVFGDALLDAVEQDKQGGAPCISLTQSAIKQLQYHLGFYGQTNCAPQFHDLLEDTDGTIFLDYLKDAFIAYPEGGIFFDVIKAHMDTIIYGLKRYKGITGVVSKYEWAARYHNFVCEDFAANHQIPTSEGADEVDAAGAVEAQKLLDYLIDISFYASKPKKIEVKPVKPNH